MAPTPNPSNPAPTVEPFPARAEPVGESAAMPMAAAATITLYMVRILKSPSLGNRPLRTTSGECRVGVISELLRGLKKKAGLAGTEAKQRAPGQGGPLQTTVHAAWATTPVYVTRY